MPTSYCGSSNNMQRPTMTSIGYTCHGRSQTFQLWNHGPWWLTTAWMRPVDRCRVLTYIIISRPVMSPDNRLWQTPWMWEVFGPTDVLKPKTFDMVDRLPTGHIIVLSNKDKGGRV